MTSLSDNALYLKRKYRGKGKVEAKAKAIDRPVACNGPINRTTFFILSYEIISSTTEATSSALGFEK